MLADKLEEPNGEIFLVLPEIQTQGTAAENLGHAEHTASALDMDGMRSLAQEMLSGTQQIMQQMNNSMANQMLQMTKRMDEMQERMEHIGKVRSGPEEQERNGRSALASGSSPDVPLETLQRLDKLCANRESNPQGSELGNSRRDSQCDEHRNSQRESQCNGRATGAMASVVPLELRCAVLGTKGNLASGTPEL